MAALPIGVVSNPIVRRELVLTSRFDPLIVASAHILDLHSMGIDMNGYKILHVLLWISVLGWGIVFGGLLLETAFIVPLWSGALPGSLTSWNINPQHVFDPTIFYWIFTSSTVLSMFGIWIVDKKTSWRRRKWLVAASTCAVGAIVYTFIYFLPRNVWIFQRHGNGLSPEEITTLGNHWVVANWFRLTIIGIGFVSALYGFRNSSQPQARS